MFNEEPISTEKRIVRFPFYVLELVDKIFNRVLNLSTVSRL